MALPPIIPDIDFFGAAQGILGTATGQLVNGFVANAAPGVSGLGTRQSRIPNNRAATNGRQSMKWMIPEGPIVEMYINPQNVTYNYRKGITNQRTKAGYVLQYWGEELTEINISGTTGTSGIEGINVLYDVYRNEQLAFDPYALSLASKQLEANYSSGVLGTGSALSSPENFVSSILGAASNSSPYDNTAPTLAALAFTVELYWSGEVYRGYFSSFTPTESANELGLFNYSMQFTATQRRGFRQNFLAWHRSATSGPVNSDPQTGTPYSFSTLVEY